MKKNLGSVDRVVRIVLALVFGGLFFGKVVTGTLGIILLVLGVVFLLTSLVNFCPLYMLFGLSTAPKKDA
ncbi:MAG: DUF2892 domain-containing protein [Lewinellaceae bacterium]|nr:DUF2892 domain-containing protein [Lewinellaceae bacterium]